MSENITPNEVPEALPAPASVRERALAWAKEFAKKNLRRLAVWGAMALAASVYNCANGPGPEGDIPTPPPPDIDWPDSPIRLGAPGRRDPRPHPLYLPAVLGDRGRPGDEVERRGFDPALPALPGRGRSRLRPIPARRDRVVRLVRLRRRRGNGTGVQHRPPARPAPGIRRGLSGGHLWRRPDQHQAVPGPVRRDDGLVGSGVAQQERRRRYQPGLPAGRAVQRTAVPSVG
jgi:hypothetical protein